MESVGVRELKNRLGHYLQAVRRGKVLVVTVRGKPIARLLPAQPPDKTSLPPDVEERMWQLVATGALTWDGGPFQVPEPVARNRGPKLLSDMVVEDRE